MTLWWARWRIKSPALRMFTQSNVDQRKHQSSASLAFVRGIHRWPVNSTHKGWKCFHLMTSSCCLAINHFESVFDLATSFNVTNLCDRVRYRGTLRFKIRKCIYIRDDITPGRLKDPFLIYLPSIRKLTTLSWQPDETKTPLAVRVNTWSWFYMAITLCGYG